MGRGVREDAKLIRRQCECEVNGVVELPGRANLKTMARTVGGLAVPNEGKWLTNWEARMLGTEALRYAAFDAIAAHAVYEHSGVAAGPEKGQKAGGTATSRGPRRSRNAAKRALLQEARGDANILDDGTEPQLGDGESA